MLSVYARNLRKQSLRTLSSLLLNQRNEVQAENSFREKIISNVCVPASELPSAKMWGFCYGVRCFSERSMRSKVEKRMQRESGKTLREIRRAKKLRKKLMTDEERLIYNLRRAKKKVALLLQKLKKYELPELPPPRHDPEILTEEQMQAFKKIGFRNRNYVPVGVRGVFGGVVQNMHLHWKFHETVQVCCDNFPKEKIKEMATMLARLSGGIVVNVHNVKTIIMFRGRNYRQPKNLIPINTLTKRKALFKARFEQALESQKLNIKKTEQELRRKGVNPDDPVAMASIQRVASTFFNAIDKREGSPYIFKEDNKETQVESEGSRQPPQDAEDDSDQEELDRFIAEIEDAADKEWAEEEAAEKEEFGRLRYWNRDNFGGRYRGSEGNAGEGSDDENGQRMSYRNQTRRGSTSDSEEEGENDGDDSDEAIDKFSARKGGRGLQSNTGRTNSRVFNRNEMESKGLKKKYTPSRHALSELEDVRLDSDGEGRNLRDSGASNHNYSSSSDDENYEVLSRRITGKLDDNLMAEDPFSESGEDDYHSKSDGEGNK
ncbi:hypothetical protein ACS0TY_028154 [Phlomoides rotata]